MSEEPDASGLLCHKIPACLNELREQGGNTDTPNNHKILFLIINYKRQAANICVFVWVGGD